MGSELKLNKEQKKAVNFGEGSVLIVAGAGTGKTMVITQRIAHLIAEKKAKPEEILALTFTDKAAEEMEERVDRLLPYGYVDLWVSTFHSFCKRVLEEHGLDIGLSTDFKLLNDTSAWLLVRQNLDKFDLSYYRPLSNPAKFIHALISHFSRCKDQAIYPEDYLNYARKVKGEEAERVKEVARAYQQYQELLLENNLLDFGDLINYCLELFKKRPLILKEYREKFKYILVDEFQDTNWVQYELVRLLAAPRNNLTVCADDDQAIYRFRGASFGNIMQFCKDFPKAKQIVLVKNYRSLQNILDLSHSFIELNNPNRLEYFDKIDKKLIATEKGKARIEHLHFKTLEQEVRGVVNKIIEILNKEKTSFNDFAILVRANSAANAFSKALERANLPYQFMSLRGLYSMPVILDTISYFKLLDNYHESSALYRVLSLPTLDISVGDIVKIIDHSKKKSQSIYQSLREIALLSLSENTINKINSLLSLIEKHTLLSQKKSVSEVFIAFLEDSGYLEHLAKDGESLNYINQFYDKIKAFEDVNLDPSLKNFMEELSLEIESGEQGRLSFDIGQGPEMIRLMTVHGAKGLEFKYVFLANLVDKRFPCLEHKDPIEIPKELIKDIIPQGDIHLEEERRLFYVGTTRAKQGLFFTSAEDYGGARKKKISRFLKEIGYAESQPKIVKESLTSKKEVSKHQKLALPGYFSFTQLYAFEKCPLQYKFAHILKVPVRGKASFSYGKTIHNTLFEFIRRSSKKPLAFEELLAIYEKEWIDYWYDSQKQKQEYFQLGRQSLEVFYKGFIKEKPSVCLINGKPALEQSFNLKIGEDTFIGFIDRIDKIQGGVEIIDYKTGSAKKSLGPEDKKQLLIYQIAAEEILGLQPSKLTYYYLDQGEKISFLGKEQDKINQKKEMTSSIKKIKESDFKPTPGWQCQWCDFKDICEYAQK